MGNSPSALRLAQALNDRDETEINRCIEHKSAKDCINDKIDPKGIKNSRFDRTDSYEFITCLGFASRLNDVDVVRRLVTAGADVTAASVSRPVLIE